MFYFSTLPTRSKISGSKAIAENGIWKTAGDDLKFTMTNGATITLEDIKVSDALIKANNTYYWFESKQFDDVSGDSHTGEWVTSLNKIGNSAAKSSGYSIVDLGYSTNLVKAGLAYKSANVTFTSKGNSNGWI